MPSLRHQNMFPFYFASFSHSWCHFGWSRPEIDDWLLLVVSVLLLLERRATYVRNSLKLSTFLSETSDEGPSLEIFESIWAVESSPEDYFTKLAVDESLKNFLRLPVLINRGFYLQRIDINWVADRFDIMSNVVYRLTVSHLKPTDRRWHLLLVASYLSVVLRSSEESWFHKANTPA